MGCDSSVNVVSTLRYDEKAGIECQMCIQLKDHENTMIGGALELAYMAVHRSSVPPRHQRCTYLV